MATVNTSLSACNSLSLFACAGGPRLQQQLLAAAALGTEWATSSSTRDSSVRVDAVEAVDAIFNDLLMRPSGREPVYRAMERAYRQCITEELSFDPLLAFLKGLPGPVCLEGQPCDDGEPPYALPMAPFQSTSARHDWLADLVSELALAGVDLFLSTRMGSFGGTSALYIEPGPFVLSKEVWPLYATTPTMQLVERTLFEMEAELRRLGFPYALQLAQVACRVRCAQAACKAICLTSECAVHQARSRLGAMLSCAALFRCVS